MSRCPCRSRLGTLKVPSCQWHWVRQQVKIWKTGQLYRHYIAEISLNLTLNHNQPTNSLVQTYFFSVDILYQPRPAIEILMYAILLTHAYLNHCYMDEHILSKRQLNTWELLLQNSILVHFSHRTFATGAASQHRALTPLTPGPIPFVTCICSNVETILSRTCLIFPDCELRTFLSTSILCDHALYSQKINFRPNLHW